MSSVQPNQQCVAKLGVSKKCPMRSPIKTRGVGPGRHLISHWFGSHRRCIFLHNLFHVSNIYLAQIRFQQNFLRRARSEIVPFIDQQPRCSTFNETCTSCHLASSISFLHYCYSPSHPLLRPHPPWPPLPRPAAAAASVPSSSLCAAASRSSAPP